MGRRVTTYCEVDGEYVAWQSVGAGPDLLFVPSIAGSNVDAHWDHPGSAVFFEELATTARLLLFDRRGLGASDRPGRELTWEDAVADAVSVLDTAGSRRCTIFAVFEGTPLALLIAATYPEQVNGLVLFMPAARFLRSDDYPHGLTSDQLSVMLDRIERTWGRDDVDEASFDIRDIEDVAFRRRHQRAVASPGVVRRLWQRQLAGTDVRHILPAVQVPVVLLDRSAADARAYDRGHLQELDRLLPRSEIVEIGGTNAVFHVDGGDVIDAVRRMVGSDDAGVRERSIATVLFVDIVGSTERAQALGDARWRDVLDAHDRHVRGIAGAFGARVVTTSGDGMLLEVAGPAKAVRLGLRLARRDRDQQPVRVGVHTGEVERRGDDLAGIAVHVGARVGSIAGEGEVLVSRTVRDLVAGSELVFEPRGRRALKGVADEWELFAAVPA